MRVVVAPDSFKGTLSAADVARALARGWRAGDPTADIREVPIADGGEGTLDAIVTAAGGEVHRARVTGPLGDPVDAAYGVVPSDGETRAVVEMARASGLTLVHESRRDPLRATTRGTGELILAACAHRPTSLLVCVGGSATNDGGAGMAQALGVRLLDQEGADLPPGGAALERLARIDARGLAPSVRRVRTDVAVDVDNPLTGAEGASAVYGPQKGATPDDVIRLDRALARLAAVVLRDLGVDLRQVPGAGAAGGLAGGLVAFLGAHLRSGFDLVADAIGLEPLVAGADVAVTGEGRYDEQSRRGKAAQSLLELAARHDVPSVLVAGRVDGHPPASRVVDLGERFGFDASMERTAEVLETVGRDLGSGFRAGARA